MKFNWGTGVLVFLILFLLACGVFIWFAFQQDVNLVHKDYYEKGVDYSEQMAVNERSRAYFNSVQTRLTEDFFIIELDELLSSQLDSGNVLMYRPSNSKNDILYPLSIHQNNISIPKSELINGRYIVKLHWYSGGLKYQIDKPVSIQ